VRLLERRQYSRWHVVTSDEIWHHAGGAPLELLSFDRDAGQIGRRELGPALRGFDSIGAVAAGLWQAARSLGDYTLMSCDVAPGFDFEDFAFVAALPDHEAAFVGELATWRGLL
jgi:predicted cupin superfamily sugar epimerase